MPLAATRVRQFTTVTAELKRILWQPLIALASDPLSMDLAFTELKQSVGLVYSTPYGGLSISPRDSKLITGLFTCGPSRITRGAPIWPKAYSGIPSTYIGLFVSPAGENYLSLNRTSRVRLVEKPGLNRGIDE